MNSINRKVLLLVLKEYQDIFYSNFNFHMFSWFSSDFNNWMDNTYGFHLNINTTTKIIKIDVTNQNKKLLFDLKYSQ